MFKKAELFLLFLLFGPLKEHTYRRLLLSLGVTENHGSRGKLVALHIQYG